MNINVEKIIRNHDISEVTDKYRNTESLNQEEVSHIYGLAGRIHAPSILLKLTIDKAIAPEAYAYLVSDAWTLAEFPSMSLHDRDWEYLFAKAGFTINGKPAERPTKPIVIYRASWPKYRRSMSWTDNLDTAKFFLKARYRFDQHLYRTTAEPERLLAYIHEEHRGEQEWIVNTYNLRIKEIEIPS